jgi:hypothetical protein
MLQSITSKLTILEQYIYIKIASKLNSLLIDAYHPMLDINAKSQGFNHYTVDHHKQF